jgi:AcrR family transcriptional regulator
MICFAPGLDRLTGAEAPSADLYEKLTAKAARAAHFLSSDWEWPGTVGQRVDDHLDVHDREPVAMPFADWWSPSARPDFGRHSRRESDRERIIDATLELWATFGFEATTVEQIAAAADVAPDHFLDYFENKDAVLMAVLDDTEQAVAAAFAHAGEGINPDQALLVAIIEDLVVISEGCGVVTAERLAAVAATVRADAHQLASAAELADALVEATRDRSTVDLTRDTGTN